MSILIRNMERKSNQRKVVLLDSSFVLEIFLGREKAVKCIDYLQNPEIICFINMLTLHHIYYFSLKSGKPLSQIHEFISNFKIFPLIPNDHTLALIILIDKDIEDAIHLANAINNNCSCFVTLDKNIKKNYFEIINIDLI